MHDPSKEDGSRNPKINGSPTSQKLLLLQKIGRILESENIILLVVTHWLHTLHDCSPDLFQGHNTIKWIYYTCQALYALAHVMMELSSGRSIFRRAKIIVGSLGSELILWTIASRIEWTLINLCVLVLALACTDQFINFLGKVIQPLGDNIFSEVDLDMA